jgi:hypothetical protein
MKSHLLLSGLAVLLFCCDKRPTVTPIALHHENPHYFSYKGKPLVLITSGEHYGALMNLDFDYTAYLNTLSKDGLNLTRVFAGPYVEPVGAFKIEENTLAPDSQRFVCPWARSETAGYANGGNKFDLSKWDESYFKRLHDFMAEAEQKDVIVEFTLFCPFYGDAQWNISPMNGANNVNGDTLNDRTHVYTLDKSGSLLAVQESLVRKIVHELKNYTNLIYEICNEPYFGGVTMEWQHHIADLIREQEKEFAHPHLISQNIANGSEKIKDPHPAVSVFNFHYATPPLAVKHNYHLNKVIGDNETGFKGTADSVYRKEGWDFVLAGGALYNNLDYSFTADREDGTFQYPPTQPGGGTPALRKQLSHLQKFINSFNFLRMKPDTAVIVNSLEIKNAQVLAESGKQYGIYTFAKGPLTFRLSIPPGTYEVEFINPLTGDSEKSEPITSAGTVELTTPAYAEDVAIKIVNNSLR